MQLSNYISNCRHRSVIVNKRGRQVGVTCNRCPDCMARRSNRLTQLCVQEKSNYKYCFHITLTYNDAYTPRARFIPQFDEETGNYYLTYIDITKRTINRNYFGKVTKLVDTYSHDYNKIIATDTIPFHKVRNFYDFYSKTKRYSKHYNHEDNIPYKNIRYLRKQDVQEFNKRLRETINRHSDASYTFFAVGEYGPQTFRPHYHILLYTNSRFIYENIERLVDKCWPYGYTLTKPVGLGDNQLKYVAGYCNSFSRLPRYLQIDGLAPFSLHSRSFGHLANPEVRDYLYEAPERFFTHKVFRTSNNSYQFIKTSSLEHTYYPRPYNYEFQNFRNLFTLYTCYKTISEKFPHCDTVSELTRCVLKYYHTRPSLNHFLQLLELVPYTILKPKCNSVSYPLIQLKSPFHYEDLFPSTTHTVEDYLTDEDKQVYSRIYTSLLLSKKFLEFNCAKHDVYHVMEIIIDYYNKKALHQLREMYEQQIDYFQHTGSTDYTLFYHMNYYQYKEAYKNSSYIKNINKAKDMQYDRNIKHKALNDKNLIFC